MPAEASDHESTRERIIQAAGPIFAEQGYEGATVRDLCKAADVNVASVNYYFGDKRKLYLETVRRAHAARMKTAAFPTWTEETSPEDKLHDFIYTLLQRMLAPSEQPWQSRLMMREILQPSAACRELVREQFRPQMQALMRIVAELLPADHGLPEPELRKAAFSIVGQCLYYRVAGEVASLLTPPGEPRAHDDLEQLAEHIRSFSLAALRHWPKSGRRNLASNVSPTTEPEVETAP